MCYIEDNVLFKCGGEIVLCLGFSRLILLFWFYVLCTTLHVSLWILGYVQVMGNCFWNRSFLAFCELKSLFFSTCQVSFERLNWKWLIYPWWDFEPSSSILFGVFCPIDCSHNSLGLTLVDTSWFTCMLGDDLDILFL